MRLEPVEGHLVGQEHAHDVVAPPYDSLTAAGRRAVVAEEPETFLAALPTGDADSDDLSANRRALARLLAAGRYERLPAPSLLVQQLDTEYGATVAVIGDLRAGDYLDGRVRPHERIRPARRDDLVEHLRTLGVVSSPVSVVHRPDVEVTRRTEAVRGRTPRIDARLRDDARLRVWVVEDPDEQHGLAAAVADTGALTIADGHHRAAAIAAHVGEHGRVLTAVSPSDHLQVLAFHRRVDGLEGVTVDRVTDALRTRDYLPQPLPGASSPERAGRVHVVVAGRWLAVALRRDGDDPGAELTGTDAAADLDASRVDADLLDVLRSLAPDPHHVGIVPVPATAGLDALEAPGAVGVALAPADMEQLLRIADGGGTMPPKSTYLVPKLRSGVLVIPRTGDASTGDRRAVGGREA